MIGNKIIQSSLQIQSVETVGGKKMTRTIPATCINQAAIRDNDNEYNVGSVDNIARKIYAVSTNSYNDTIIIGKVDVNEGMAV